MIKMYHPPKLVLDYLRNNFTYNPETGQVFQNGKVLSRKKSSYHVVSLYKLQKQHPDLNIPDSLYRHRVIWFLVHNKWPELEIDHINNDKHDDRLINLRLATRQQQRFNIPKFTSRTFSSQFKGVHFDSETGKWRTTIRYNGKTYALGRYYDEIEAAQAYDYAAQKYFGKYACLNFPHPD